MNSTAGKSVQHLKATRAGSRKRVKVLHLITRLIVGGAQDNTLLTAERHDRQRYEVHVASGAGGELAKRAEDVADAFHVIPSLVNPISPHRDVRALVEITRLLRRQRFDILHTHSSKAGYLGRLAARIVGIPAIVHTIHGSPFHQLQPWWTRQLYISIERSARRLADYIITLSERDRIEFMSLGIVDPDRSQTIYTGLDFERISSKPGLDTLRIRQTLRVPESGNLIIMVGRLDPQKAPHLLIRAFAKVLDAFPSTVLAFAGDGPLSDELQSLARELKIEGAVRFLGTRNDVPDLLASADIFCFSSLREAMGRAMLEAMFAGLPVVVPYTSGIPEVVKHNQTGLLFEVGDVDGIASNLIDLLKHPTKRYMLGQQGREQVLRYFDVDAMVESIEGVYESVLPIDKGATNSYFLRE